MAIRVNPLPGSAAHSPRGSAGTEPIPPLLLVGKKFRGGEDLAGTWWLLSAHQLVAGVTLVLRSPLPAPPGPGGGGKPQRELGLRRHSGPREPPLCYWQPRPRSGPGTQDSEASLQPPASPSTGGGHLIQGSLSVPPCRVATALFLSGGSDGEGR